MSKDELKKSGKPTTYRVILDDGTRLKQPPTPLNSSKKAGTCSFSEAKINESWRISKKFQKS